MSKTIAIISFKELPGRKFEVKKAYLGSCGTANKPTCCAFMKGNCTHTAHAGICMHANVYFKEIKK